MVVRTKEWEPLSDEQPVDGMIVRSSMKNLPSKFFFLILLLSYALIYYRSKTWNSIVVDRSFAKIVVSNTI